MTYNNPRNLPTPGAPLRLKLYDGSIVEGCRPSYIDKATEDDPLYHDRCGNHIAVRDIDGWAYQAYEQPGDHLPDQPRIDPINQYRK